MADDARPRAFLVDGTYTVFRAYYAISRLTSPDGTPTNAVYGFVASLRKVVRENAPERFAVAFDLEGPTYRDELYAEYKAHREPPPDDLVPQIDLAMKASEALGWRVVTREGLEADDIVAHLARRAREAGYHAVIVTADKDLYQLVGDGVSVLNPMKPERLLDADGIAEVFGVPPEQVADVLALMGDAVDNVPGVPGVGEKTAKSFVARYGSLDAVLERARLFAEVWEAKEAALERVGEKDLDGALAAIEPARGAAGKLVEVEREAGGEAGDDLVARFGAVAELDAEAGIRSVGKALRDVAKKTQPKVWLSIAQNVEQARLSDELVRIPDDAPLDDLDLQSMTIADVEPSTAAAFFRELGFRTLTEELESEAREAGTARADQVGASLDVEILRDEEALKRFVGELREASEPIAFDTETTSLEPRRAEIVGLSFARSGAGGVYVPVGHRGDGEQLSVEAALAALEPLFTDESVPKIGQNAKYDLAVLAAAGAEVRGLAFDTLIASQLVDAGRGASHKLDDLALRYLDQRMISYSEVAEGDDGQISLDLVPVEKVARYAVEDAVVTQRLAPLLRAKLEDAELVMLFETVEMPLVPILESMERSGLRVDVAHLEALSKRFHGEVERLVGEIHELAGHEFNINSPQQLRVVLFEELGLKPSGRRTQKTKALSTGQQVLEALAEQHPLPAKILEYRELSKLVGTYVDTLPELVDERDGRVHGSFNQLGAATGRLSSSDPNLQNIPVRTELGREIRRAFVPETGSVFLSADYSQMELRILAHLAGDETLADAFRRGEDIHTYTASVVLGVDPDEVTPELRARAKAVNFGIIYGMSEFRLAREQGMSREDARAFIDAYFRRYDRIKGYVDGVTASVQELGFVTTLLGRRRHFDELTRGADDERRGQARLAREALLRQAVNTTVQGSGADIVKRAMVELAPRLAAEHPEAQLVLQVHDELLVEVPAEQAEAVAETMREVMESAVELSVPLDVEVRRGSTWADAH